MKKVKNFLENSIITILLILIAICGVSVVRGDSYSKVDGNSMYPTLESGQAIKISKKTEYNKNDIVSLTFNEEQKKINEHGYDAIVKRIVAVSGDTVEVKNGYVYVDGQLQEDFSYDGWSNYVHLNQEKEASYVLKDGEYFVMGDNYASSRDSRYYGLFTKDQIEGLVTVKDNWITKILSFIDF